MAKIVKLNRSPKANTTMLSRERGFTFYGDKPKNPAFDSARGIYRTAESTPANENKTIRARERNIARLNNEADRMLKLARGSKTPSTPVRIAGAIGRTAGRMAGPVGALVGMTRPAGEGSDRPQRAGMSLREQSAANRATMAKRPTSSSLNAPARTSPSGSARPTSSSLNAPSRTAPSGGNSRSSSTPSRSGPSSSLSAPSRTAPSKAAPSKAAPSKSSAPSRPSSGPTSAPSRTAPSKANLGTSRFAKGGAIKRRKK